MSRFAAIGLILAALITASLLPLFDPDEGFYPATAAESVDAGHWWDLRFNGEPRWDKPVLAYALIEGSFAIFGRSAAAARLPSALEGGALVLLVGILVSAIAGGRAGALSAVVIASTLGVQVFARAAHPEIALVLSMGVTELLLIMWLVVPRADRWRALPVFIGLSMGYGLLAKGPVAVVVPGLGALIAAPFVTSLRERLGQATRDGLIAAAAALAVAAPWFAAMTWRHGSDFLQQALWAQNVGRFAGQMPEHGQSAWVFALAAAIGFTPWILLLPAALAALRDGRAATPANAVRFCAVVMAGVTLVFYMLSASKLASYSLAVLPPLAVVVGLYLDEALAGRRLGSARTFLIASVILAGLGLLLLSTPQWLGSFVRLRDVVGGVPAANAGEALWSLVVPVSIVLIAAAIALAAMRMSGRIVTLVLLGFAAPLALLLAAKPVLDDAYPWRRFGDQIATTPGPVWIQNYRASSLTFYAGRSIERVAGDEALERLVAEAGDGWLVIGQDWSEKPILATRLAAGRARIVERSQRLILVRLTR